MKRFVPRFQISLRTQESFRRESSGSSLIFVCKGNMHVDRYSSTIMVFGNPLQYETADRALLLHRFKSEVLEPHFHPRSEDKLKLYNLLQGYPLTPQDSLPLYFEDSLNQMKSGRKPANALAELFLCSASRVAAPQRACFTLGPHSDLKKKANMWFEENGLVRPSSRKCV